MREGGGEGRRLECLCVTQRVRGKQAEREASVFVSPPNQFSWEIYHRLQQRRQEERR